MINKCTNCGNDFISKRSSKKFCSTKCYKEYFKRPEIITKINEKRKLTNLKKYGVENPAKNEEVKKKAEQTCIKKYGAKSPTLNKKIRNKQIKTLIKRYGVKTAVHNETIKNKYKSTLLKNYGVDAPFKSKEILKKAKETNIKKYGVDNPSKLKEIREKIKNTCIKKYGTVCPAQNEKIKNKIITTRLKNHYNKIILNFKNVTPLFTEDEYKGNRNTLYSTKYKFKCNVCNNEFYDTIINGRVPRCSYCFPPKTSVMQNDIYEYIKTILNKNEKIILNDRNLISPMELDLYIPNKKIAIEFNGLYWHSELNGKERDYHIKKTKSCSKKKIKLIQIFEDEWIYKNDIIKNKLKNLLLPTINENSIYNNKSLTIKEIKSDESADFLNNYDLKGNDKSTIKIGAFDENKLIGVITFSKLKSKSKKIKSKNHYRLNRLCTLNNQNIEVPKKLLDYFIKNYNPSKITAYLDRRWSDVEYYLYEKLGFNLIEETECNYWYIDKNYTRRYCKSNFKKDKIKKELNFYDASLSEWENMQLNGYDRIWDCGNLKYELKI